MFIFRITPIFATQVEDPPGQINLGFLLGAISFGVGWGLFGLCPGSFYLLIPLKSLKIPLFWGISCAIGVKTAGYLQSVGKRAAPVEIK